jgi:hypothetical protein
VNYHLVVTQDFGLYKKGMKIEAADEVAMILASPQHPHVVKIAAPNDPAPAPAAPTEKPALLS